MKIIPKKITTSTLAVAMTGLAVTSAPAVLLVYEGFQYVDAVDLDTGAYPASNTFTSPFHLKGESDSDPGDVDATGLAGTYVENGANDGDDWFVVKDSLTFGDLPTSGNRIGFRDNLDSDQTTRGLTSSLGSESKIWFSILMNPTDTRSASAGGFALTDNALAAGKIINTTTGVQGFGIGSVVSHKFRPYAWDGTTRIDGTAELNTSQGTTYLLIGEVSFGTGAGGKDQYSLYNYNLTTSGGTVTANMTNLDKIGDTIEADVTQSALDLINLNRQVRFDADEIRIGTTLDDVLGIPEPTTTALLGLGGLALILRRRK